ncbi:MAG: M1 family metallopeptidase [Anaerolineaceae bacterium]|nr:M1 family metallopeptidase [Anaerolineaceae bacterium]
MISKPVNWLFIISVLVLTSCTGQQSRNSPTLEIPTNSVTLTSPPEKTPTSQTSPTLAREIYPTPIPVPDHSALDECNPTQQAEAMQPDQEPDWQKLAINACYDLQLSIDPNRYTYSGKENLIYTNNSGRDQAYIVLRTYPNAVFAYGGALNISNVTINGKTISTQEMLPDQTAVRIQPGEPITPGATIQIRLDFSGKIPADFNSKSVYGIFGWSDPGPVIALADWFPILAGWENNDWVVSPVLSIGDAVVSNTALYQVDISLPDAWKVASTGTEITSTSSAGITTHHIVSGPVRDFAIAASPDFMVQEEQVNHIRVLLWGLPDTKNAWAKALDVAKKSITTFTQLFGVYPYKELDIVTAPLQNADGDEFPGLVYTRSSLYVDNGSNSYFSTVISHEIAHQWWYGVVGSDVLNAPWQDESLATYSALLYFEQYSPNEYAGMLMYYNQHVNDFEKASGKKNVSDSVSAFSNNDKAYTIIIYFKGSLFLVALQKQLGDEVFYAALETYYRANQYTLADPSSLLNTFQQTCSCNLGDFYQNWGLASP